MALVLQTVEKDGETFAKLKDGKPLYVDDTNNTEHLYDATASAAVIASRNLEAQRNREKLEQAEARLKAYEGIEDPDAARKALETVANLEAGDLVAADKVAELKAGVEAATQKKFEQQVRNLTTSLDAATKERDTLTKSLHNEKVTNAFATSKYIADKLVLPAPAVQRIFSDNFKVEDGKIVAYDFQGAKVFSMQNPTQEPDFEEALSLIVGGYQYRDSILKGTGGSGGGGNGGQPHIRPGDKKMSRADFDRLPLMERTQKMAEGFQLLDQ